MDERWSSEQRAGCALLGSHPSLSTVTQTAPGQGEQGAPSYLCQISNQTYFLQPHPFGNKWKQPSSHSEHCCWQHSWEPHFHSHEVSPTLPPGSVWGMASASQPAADLTQAEKEEESHNNTTLCPAHHLLPLRGTPRGSEATQHKSH